MELRRITLVGGLVLVVLTFVAGLASFEIMRHQSEQILTGSLEQTLHSKSTDFANTIARYVQEGDFFATRPFIIQNVVALNHNPDDSAASFALRRAAYSLQKTNLSALAFYGSDGKPVSSAGAFSQSPAVRIPLKGSEKASLLWDQGLVIHVEAQIQSGHHTIGEVHLEARMSELSEQLKQGISLGKTAELVVCTATTGRDRQCLPAIHHQNPFVIAQRDPQQEMLPIDHALAGKSGFMRTHDYLGDEVIAAYTPVDGTGLGMVLKVESRQLFRPIAEKLAIVIPVLIALLVLGILVLRWLVTPLIAKAFASEQETRRINKLLADREARFRAIFDNVEDGIIVLNERNTIESVNPAAEQVFGYAPGEMNGQDVGIIIPGPDRDHHGQYIQQYLAKGEARRIGMSTEMAAQRKDGSTLPIELRVAEMQVGHEHLFVGTLRDITERKRNQERIAHLATHDSLTDLPNRNLLGDRFRQAVAHAQRNPGIKVGMLFLDLDHFKPVNDTHGHDIGDQLLKAVAKRIRNVIRSEDTIARQGGDEFIIVLPMLDTRDAALSVANKLLDALATPFLVDDLSLEISASIGIALYPDDGTDMEMLLKRSDEAMYAAKENGRNGVQTTDSLGTA